MIQHQQQHSTSTQIMYNNISMEFHIRENITYQTFDQLLKEVFQIQGQILGLVDKQSKSVYDIVEFCNLSKNFKSGQKFQLIVNYNNSTDTSENQKILSTPTQNMSRRYNGQTKSQYRNKSADQHRINNRQNSIKNEEHNIFYIEDYEAFMGNIIKEGSTQIFTFLFLDEKNTMKQYGPLLSRSYQQNFPQINFYYSLYPSKRQRGPFQPSDNTYLLSFQNFKIKIYKQLCIQFKVFSWKLISF
ncbi:hypothetical protein IMG5_034560 [Ichthyophthirius multifiliis]|uniref:Uncharacterized protein n=1 Tax=Ichthyophthirius multifiliis TaxID=5932 RepID=G0QLP7_ICHMU|nr:hypothetical protein IMG5_034560 [Ichthyophthirius multifiliis]EGR33857.1 hypothetical protein IMG5_034560 [Ichthyophthirius multifiliis]|eukprot:XP_004039081.1 hypothetical protein IMG5_034560 [Ichthyophthirius multifiliis]